MYVNAQFISKETEMQKKPPKNLENVSYETS